MIFKNYSNEMEHAYTGNSYFVEIEEQDLPHASNFIPLSSCVLNFTIKQAELASSEDDQAVRFHDLQLCGHCFGDFKLYANEKTKFLGVHLRPTTLYKVFGDSLKEIQNKILLMQEYRPKLYAELVRVFRNYDNDLPQFDANLNSFFRKNDMLAHNPKIEWIDEAVRIIEQEKGLIKVQDLITNLPFSQKTFETNFKKVIGLTPGQFSRQIRFLNYLREYHTTEAYNNELLYAFQYYDLSHFSKEVKYFTGKTPKKYFDSEYSDLKKIISF
ncbi:MAG: hypothetical protein CMB99_09110 [Flavobacteriaceae bacterium]|nr:hypothetical protein [Flavobacteriaceae bacterium]|tara:strand:+ start:517758 stop:518570 length:813 start_codon:yes stop_codon:yes gene_type:complete